MMAAYDSLELAARSSEAALRARFGELAPALVVAYAWAALGGAVLVMLEPRRWKVVASWLTVGSALGFLALVSLAPQRSYYKHPDEVLARPAFWRGKHLLVHGTVTCGSLEQVPGTHHYRFRIESQPPRPTAQLRSDYFGLLPDRFQPGVDVVLQATLTDGDTLEVVPDGIMTRCPSKYQGPSPQVSVRPCPSTGNEDARPEKLR